MSNLSQSNKQGFTLEQAVQHFGGRGKLAAHLQVDPATVWRWGVKGSIPTSVMAHIELLSGGKLKSGIAPVGD